MDEDIEIKPRTSIEVAQRILALLAVVERVYQKPPDHIRDWVKTNKVAEHFSSDESDFFFSDNVTEKQLIHFSWRAETLASLLWSIYGIDKMPSLDEIVDLSSVALIKEMYLNPSKFLTETKLRPEEEIDEFEESLCEQHWAVRDAQINHKTIPPGINPEIIQERRYGSCWLVGFGEDWDDVPTDT